MRLLKTHVLGILQRLSPKHPLRSKSQPIYATDFHTYISEAGATKISMYMLSLLLVELPPRGLDTCIDVNRWLDEVRRSKSRNRRSRNRTSSISPRVPQASTSLMQRLNASSLEQQEKEIGVLLRAKDTENTGAISIPDMLDILFELGEQSPTNFALFKKALNGEGMVHYARWLQEDAITPRRTSRPSSATPERTDRKYAMSVVVPQRVDAKHQIASGSGGSDLNDFPAQARNALLAMVEALPPTDASTLSEWSSSLQSSEFGFLASALERVPRTPRKEVKESTIRDQRRKGISVERSGPQKTRLAQNADVIRKTNEVTQLWQKPAEDGVAELIPTARNQDETDPKGNKETPRLAQKAELVRKTTELVRMLQKEAEEEETKPRNIGEETPRLDQSAEFVRKAGEFVKMLQQPVTLVETNPTAKNLEEIDNRETPRLAQKAEFVRRAGKVVKAWQEPAPRNADEPVVEADSGLESGGFKRPTLKLDEIPVPIATSPSGPSITSDFKIPKEAASMTSNAAFQFSLGTTVSSAKAALVKSINSPFVVPILRATKEGVASQYPPDFSSKDIFRMLCPLNYRDRGLDRDRLSVIIQQFSPDLTETQLDAVWAYCDRNESGFVEYDEFVENLWTET